MVFSCCKKKVEVPVYEPDDARYWMQQLDDGLDLSITSFDICKLLLDFPTSYRRTRTSPVRLKPENVPLHDRLIRLLTNIAQDAVLESERMAYSFWNSFSATNRPYPTTTSVDVNKLETWIHLHNFVKRKRSDERHTKVNSFSYLIDPKATLKHLGVFSITNIERVLNQVLASDLDADREEKAIEKKIKDEEKAAKKRQKYFESVRKANQLDSESSDSEEEDSSSSDDSSDESNDSDGSTESEESNNRFPDMPPAIAAALNELADELEKAEVHAATLKDEWGNKVSKAETSQREKIVKTIKRRMDKWFLKASGAKFEPFRRCEKVIKKVRMKFEKYIGKIILKAKAQRESHKRAKRRLDIFNDEQSYFQIIARYDRPSEKTEMKPVPPGTLGPELRCKPGGACFWRPWREVDKRLASWHHDT